MTEILEIKPKNKHAKPSNTWYLEVKSNVVFTTNLFSLLSEGFQNTEFALILREINPNDLKVKETN